MQAAAMAATRFAIVTTVQPAVSQIEELVYRYGATRACAGVRAADVGVLALVDPSADTYQRIVDATHRLLSEQRADAIVLGCAAMSPLRSRLARDLRVPVIDGIGAAVKFAESLLALGIATSKRGAYATPGDVK